jgi:hypothetical protein
VIAPIKRAAWTQSLIGLPLKRIAEAIMAIAQTIAQRTSVVRCFLEVLGITVVLLVRAGMVI